GIQKSKNRVRCFSCDVRSLSVLDLVMSVNGTDLRGAIRWITSKFPVPPTPKGKHLEHAQRWPERARVGTSASRLEFILRSGVWASFTPAERAILPVLDVFADGDRAMISYAGLMRFSGVGSRTTIAAALRHFEKLRLIQICRESTGTLRACGSYVLTFND